MTSIQVIYLKFKQFLLNLIIDSINRRLIVYEKFNATHQKINQKVNVFKIYLKEIEKELSSFDEYYNIMLFLIKLILVLKNKLLIIKDVSNTKETILFKAIMQETIFNRTHNNNDHNYSQLRAINLLSISPIEINNLTNFIILVISKKKVNQKVILKYQRKTNARMQK